MIRATTLDLARDIAMFLILSLLLLASWRAIASTQFYYLIQEYTQTQVLTVCPDDYVPRNGCVTLDHLYGWSDTTYRFVPAFKMLPNQVIRFVHVRNIILDTAGPDRAKILCLGENSGFYFERIQGLTVRNLQFIDCAMSNVSYDIIYSPNILIDCTILILISRDIQLYNVSFEKGKPNAFSVFAANVYGNITIFPMQHSLASSRSIHNEPILLQTVLPRSCSENLQATIADSLFDSATHNLRGATMNHNSFAIRLVLYIFQEARICIRNVSMTNNTHHSGIYVHSNVFIDQAAAGNGNLDSSHKHYTGQNPLRKQLCSTYQVC